MINPHHHNPKRLVFPSKLHLNFQILPPFFKFFGQRARALGISRRHGCGRGRGQTWPGDVGGRSESAGFAVRVQNVLNFLCSSLRSALSPPPSHITLLIRVPSFPMSGKRKNTSADSGPAAKAQAVTGDAPGSASAAPVFVHVPASPGKAAAAKPAALQAVAAAVAATGDASPTTHLLSIHNFSSTVLLKCFQPPQLPSKLLSPPSPHPAAIKSVSTPIMLFHIYSRRLSNTRDEPLV